MKRLEAELAEAMAGRRFARCGELQQKIEAVKAKEHLLAQLETKLTAAMNAKRFGECGTIQKEIEAIQARAV